MKRVETQHQLSKKRQVFDFYVGVFLNLVICKYEPDKGKIGSCVVDNSVSWFPHINRIQIQSQSFVNFLTGSGIVVKLLLLKNNISSGSVSVSIAMGRSSKELLLRSSFFLGAVGKFGAVAVRQVQFSYLHYFRFWVYSQVAFVKRFEVSGLFISRQALHSTIEWNTTNSTTKI